MNIKTILLLALVATAGLGADATSLRGHRRALKKKAGVWGDAGVHSAHVTASKVADLGHDRKAGVDASATGKVSAKCTGPGCTADASAKVGAGARISQTAALGDGMQLSNYAQVNATATASAHGSVSNAGVTGSAQARAGVSAGVGTKLETDDGKASLSANAEAGLKAEASAKFGAGVTEGIPGVNGEAKADAMAYAKADAEAKAEVAPNTTVSANAQAMVAQGAKAKAKFNADLGKGNVGYEVGAMVGNGASVSTTATVDSDYAGGSVTVGANVGLVGIQSSIGLTVEDCNFKLEGMLSVGLDVGLSVGGSVSINPCEIVDAIGDGFVLVFKEIGRFFLSIFNPAELKRQEEAEKKAQWLQIMQVASKTPAVADYFVASLHKLPEYQKWLDFMKAAAASTGTFRKAYEPILGKEFMKNIDEEYENLVNAGKRLRAREAMELNWCKTTWHTYDIHPLKNWGSLTDQKTKDTWESYDCNTKMAEVEMEWCQMTKKTFDIVPHKSWGSLADQPRLNKEEVMGKWESFGCNSKAPMKPFWSMCYSNENCPLGDRDLCIKSQCQAKGLKYQGKWHDCGGWKFQGYCQ